MVVCKCRKATRIYCFVHKVPVCGECICFPEHEICVVQKYSDWVVNGDYDWPPSCPRCQAELEAGSEITRLGCLHVMHTNCLVLHIQSFPPQTAPAGYVCPQCSSPIWPPKNIKDTGSCLHTKLKEAIVQSGLEKNIFGNYLVSLPPSELRAAPPAFASDPLIHISASEDGEKGSSSSFDYVKDKSVTSSSGGLLSLKHSEIDIVEIEDPSLAKNHFLSDQDPNFIKSKNATTPGATTRKGSHNVERLSSEVSYYADDEDGTHRKYTRRGPFGHKFLRMLLPFWSSALPTLPVTAPSRKEKFNADDAQEGRTRQHRPSRMDPRKILLVMAIMACMATMGILYYRLAQRSLGVDIPEDLPQ
ncbi:zinc finger protein-like 1 homolog [Phalaenopsis equestris]|uniref:zinc finger protein-like 1 homolog n=1 Tax=Phalaenopsis equestris TaxID=78828 RepID=UPI0009E209BE|nr:zinc finger protein-like 1 homolog [Phalaenopsis equestris]XP_020579185.1 zinc finger protein-like 1 homolog [Phalaenopsis equestris]